MAQVKSINRISDNERIIVMRLEMPTGPVGAVYRIIRGARGWSVQYEQSVMGRTFITHEQAFLAVNQMAAKHEHLATDKS